MIVEFDKLRASDLIIDVLRYYGDNRTAGNLKYAPDVWKQFVQKGRKGIKALKAPRIFKIQTKYDQLRCNEEGKNALLRLESIIKIILLALRHVQ